MKVLGISCSPRPGQTTDRLVQEILNNIQAPTEFVSLSGRHIGPCLGCLGCVADNVCKVRDDMGELRSLIVEADALVIGAPNYFGMLNGLAHCFLERLYQFRHREGAVLHGKLGVAVGVGSAMPDAAIRDIERFFSFSRIEPMGNVAAIGTASCFTCGHGEECREGAIHRIFGPETRITADLKPNLSKQPESLAAARVLGEKLTQRLKQR